MNDEVLTIREVAEYLKDHGIVTGYFASSTVA